MHQVFRFDPEKSASTPLITLGEDFHPGSDEKHFCKPSAVTVSVKDGFVFVADGYCNNRIVKFDLNGKFLAQFGEASVDVLPSELKFIEIYVFLKLKYAYLCIVLYRWLSEARYVYPTTWIIIGRIKSNVVRCG